MSQPCRQEVDRKACRSDARAKASGAKSRCLPTRRRRVPYGSVSRPAAQPGPSPAALRRRSYVPQSSHQVWTAPCAAGRLRPARRWPMAVHGKATEEPASRHDLPLSHPDLLLSVCSSTATARHPPPGKMARDSPVATAPSGGASERARGPGLCASAMVAGRPTARRLVRHRETWEMARRKGSGAPRARRRRQEGGGDERRGDSGDAP